MPKSKHTPAAETAKTRKARGKARRGRLHLVLRSSPRAGEARAGRSDLADAFVRRYHQLLERLVEAAPAESIKHALAAADDVGGLAGLLAEVGPIAPPARDPLAAARARGARAKVELLERAGGGLSAGQVAEKLGVTPAAVHARRQRGTLLAVPRANGEFVYPAFQFTEDGTLAGLSRVLQAFGVRGPWTRLSVLLAPADVLGGRTPLDALREGDADGAVLAASTYGEHLA
ncbi:MAG TPA: hypothetical protein VF746_06890 [Longimicrobium sp.]